MVACNLVAYPDSCWALQIAKCSKCQQMISKKHALLKDNTIGLQMVANILDCFKIFQLKISYTLATVGMGNQFTNYHDLIDRSSHQFSQQTKANVIICALRILEAMCVAIVISELRLIKGKRCVITERILFNLILLIA